MSSPGHRLLVLTYHFPPDGAVGGLRWAGLTKYLGALGWTSTVVTAAPSHRAPETVGVRVMSVPRSRTLSDAYRWLTWADVRAKSASAAQPSTTPRPPGFLRRLRREADTLLWFPDGSRGWILRAAARLRGLIRSTDPHVVVSSGPPHGAHLAAWLATRRTGTPWLVDLRDPWACLVWPGHPQVESLLATASARRLERLIATASTGMIANSLALVAALGERYPGRTVTWIPNGVDHELLPPPRTAPFPGFALAHAGSIHGRRDITPVLRALRTLLTRRPETEAEGCSVHLVGETDGAQRQALSRVTRELGLDGCVQQYGRVSRAQALDVLARSHVLVVLAQGQDMMIPAKLYEAVAIGRAVLVLAPPGSATASEAARLGARVVDPEEPEVLARELEELWRRRHQPAEPNGAALGYDALARRVDALLRSASER